MVDHPGVSLGLPVKGAFLQRVDVSHRKNTCKAGKAPEDHRAFLDRIAEGEGPWVGEDDFDIEDDEEHRDEVELHAEAGSAFTDGKQSSLVRSVLHLGIASLFSKENTEAERDGGEADGDDSLEDDGCVVGEHESSDSELERD